MSEKQKVDSSLLKVGHQFPSTNYLLDSSMVSDYLKAVGETSELYQSTNLVPPTAIAASAMSALSESIAFPPGSIHFHQELEFIDAVVVGETVTCQARVSNREDRGRLHMLTIEMNICGRDGRPVLTGKTGFVLAEA